MRAGSLGERQFLPYYGPHCSVRQTRDQAGVNFSFFSFGDVPQSECVNRSAARHQVARRDSDVASAANDDHATVVGEQLQVVAQIYVGEHFQNEIDVPPAGRSENILVEVCAVMIEDVMRAFAPDEIAPVVSACCAQHGQAHGTSHLNGGYANAPTGSVNQHGFAGGVLVPNYVTRGRQCRTESKRPHLGRS